MKVEEGGYCLGAGFIGPNVDQIAAFGYSPLTLIFTIIDCGGPLVRLTS